MKKIIFILTLILSFFLLVSCGNKDNKEEDKFSDHIKIGINGNWYIDDYDTGIKARATDGKDGTNGTNGTNGSDGLGIVSVTKKESVGNVDTYIITYTDGTSTEFSIENGKSPYVGDNGNWFINGIDSGIKATGTNGKDGKSIKDITLYDSKDGYNFYLITYTDDTTSEFKIRMPEYDPDFIAPYIDEETNTWVINGIKTNIKASGTDGTPGSNGTDGEDGLGIANIEFDNEVLIFTLTDGTKKSFNLNDIIDKQDLTVTFYPENGRASFNQTVVADKRATIPDEPVRDGYTFVGWYTGTVTDGVVTYLHEWLFDVYSVSDDISLYAKWTAKPYTLSFNTNGGTPISAITVYAGSNYTLPTPSKANAEFIGWYYGTMNIPLTGTYIYNRNLTLSAVYKETIEDGKIHLSKVEDLVKLGLPEYLNQSFVLDNDIDCGGANFEGFGSEAKPFTGILDGNNFKIHNLTISSDEGYSALFKYNNGTIKNLTIEDVTVSGNNDSAVLVGYNGEDAVIEHVIIDGTNNSVADKKAILIVDNYANALTDITLTGTIETEKDSDKSINVGSLIAKNNADVTLTTINSSVHIASTLTINKNVPTYIAGIVGDSFNQDITLNDVRFDGSIQTTLKMVCDDLVYYPYVSGIVSNAKDITGNIVKSTPSIELRLEANKSSNGVLTENTKSEIKPYLASGFNTVDNLTINDVEIGGSLIIRGDIGNSIVGNANYYQTLEYESFMNGLINTCQNLTYNHLIVKNNITNNVNFDAKHSNEYKNNVLTAKVHISGVCEEVSVKLTQTKSVVDLNNVSLNHTINSINQDVVEYQETKYFAVRNTGGPSSTFTAISHTATKVAGLGFEKNSSSEETDSYLPNALDPSGLAFDSTIWSTEDSNLHLK